MRASGRYTRIICGVDEAGRGPWAGPVVAAAVILDRALPIEGLDDSKKLSPRERERLTDHLRPLPHLVRDAEHLNLEPNRRPNFRGRLDPTGLGVARCSRSNFLGMAHCAGRHAVRAQLT